ncbi:anaphase-promoting complex subunit 7 [Spatholobus suberectus]|nr:anaphase-promoting complex subunit 7 [Spatholobus suberectus]
MALDLQGFRSNELNVALSPLIDEFLTDDERGDTLVKKVELHITISKCCHVDSEYVGGMRVTLATATHARFDKD